MCRLYWIACVETIKNVSISELHSFRNHPFKVETNTGLCELMRSIEKEGVLVPLLVRTNPYGDGYEVISGHRRKEAALWAGETEVPVVIRELDDDQAVVAMVDSNLHRENLKLSEKAFAYRMKLEAMKHQGKKVLADDITLAQVEPRFAKKEPGDVFYDAMRSNELLAKQAGESVAQIKRYIRLTNLIPKILDMVDDGKIAFTVAVELSYLKEEEQYELHAIMDLEQCTPSLSQACRLKVMSQHGTLDMDAICMVLEEEKPNQREQIKLRADALAKYFPEDYTPKQKTDYEEKYKINSFYAIDDKNAIYSFSIRFVHTPTLLNYWHFEMKLYPSLDEVFPRKEEKKKWMRMMVQDFLQKQFVLALVEDEEDVAKIDAVYYLKE